MDYTGLKAEIALPKYAGMTDALIASALTAATITVVGDILATDAFAVLASSSTGDWGRVSNRAGQSLTGNASTDTPIIAARTAAALLQSGATIKTSQIATQGVLQSSLTALSAAGDVSQASSNAILALTQTTTSRAMQLGFDPAIHDMVQEIAAARKWG